MDDIHGTHCTPSIVENPLLVKVQVFPSQLLIQFLDDVAHDRAGVVAMSRDGPLGKIVKMRGLKDVEPFEVLVKIVEERSKRGDQQSERGQGGGTP